MRRKVGGANNRETVRGQSAYVFGSFQPTEA